MNKPCRIKTACRKFTGKCSKVRTRRIFPEESKLFRSRMGSDQVWENSLHGHRLINMMIEKCTAGSSVAALWGFMSFLQRKTVLMRASSLFSVFWKQIWTYPCCVARIYKSLVNRLNGQETKLAPSITKANNNGENYSSRLFGSDDVSSTRRIWPKWSFIYQ